MRNRTPNDKVTKTKSFKFKSPGSSDDRMKKYMRDPSSFPNFWDVIQILKNDMDSLTDWQKDVANELKIKIISFIKKHLDDDSQTRSTLQSLDESIWLDPETDTLKLTEEPKPVLGYLPKYALIELDDLVLSDYSTRIKILRDNITKYQSEMRASTDDYLEIAGVVERLSLKMNDLFDHYIVEAHWKALHETKMPVIKDTQTWEEFLQEVEHFEMRASGDATRYKNSNALKLNDENKFRKYARVKLDEIKVKLVKSINEYEEKTGRLYEVDGCTYKQMLIEQMFARPTMSAATFARVSVNKISTSEKNKYSGHGTSNLLVDAQKKPLVKSLYERGIESNNLLTSGAANDDLIQAMQENGHYNNSKIPDAEKKGYEKEYADIVCPPTTDDAAVEGEVEGEGE